MGNRNLHTLRDFAGKIEVTPSDGQMGGKNKSTGAAASDVSIELPLGTVVWRVKSTHQPVSAKLMYKHDLDLGRVERLRTGREGKAAISETKGVFELSEQKYNNYNDYKNYIKKSKVLLGMEAEYIGEVVEDKQTLVVARGGAGGRGQALRNSLRRRWSTIEACEASSLGQLRGAAFALGSAVSKAAAKRKGPARVAHV